VYNLNYSRQRHGGSVGTGSKEAARALPRSHSPCASQRVLGFDAFLPPQPLHTYAGSIEGVLMPSGGSRERGSADCTDQGGSGWSTEDGRALWSNVDAGLGSAKDRLGRLARTIESDVIPRLVQLHRGATGATPAGYRPSQADVEGFVACIISESQMLAVNAVDEMRRRGLTIEALYLDLFAPAARRLGEMWEDDRCDFSVVTIGLGRLQRLLRELSPAFGSEVEHPPSGRRILLTQPDDEQHSFGLSMVAEFFRRSGWEVLGGIAGSGIDVVAAVRRDWFDAVGFSVGTEAQLDWVSARVAKLRRAARNSALVVLVGGPIFTLHPEWVQRVGADGASPDGGAAPALAERLLSARIDSNRSNSKSI